MALFSKTLGQLTTEVRSITDRDGDTAVTDAQIETWLIAAYDQVINLWLRLDRDYWIQQATFSTTTTNKFNITSPSTSNFVGVRAVDKDIGGGLFTRLKRWNFHMRNTMSRISYRVSQMEVTILPEELGKNGTYRVYSLYRPTPPPGPAFFFDLPVGADVYMVAKAAASLRMRFEENPQPHLDAAAEAFEQVRRELAVKNQGDQLALGSPFGDWDYDDNDDWE